MIIVGLTGGMGSGKTYISNLFKEFGIPVFDSDSEAKKLMHSNITIKSSLIAKYGHRAYSNNELNRKFIAKKVFADKKELQWLNSIIHPEVARIFDTWKTDFENNHYIIKEAAILIESGAYKSCDKIISVNAPEQLRIKRVMERDNLTLDKVKERLKNQISDNERNKYSNFIVYNHTDSNIKKQITKINNTLINM